MFCAFHLPYSAMISILVIKKISGAWDPSIRIEPPNIVPENKKHKNKAPEKFEEVNIIFFNR